MPHERPLTFRVARGADFSSLFRVLLLMVAASAVLSPWPMAMAALGCAFWLYGRREFSNHFGRQVRDKLTLIIYPDGRVRLQSGTLNTLEGGIGQHHWCTCRGAVLGIQLRDEFKKVVLLAGQQGPDDYRRLLVWLRQGRLNAGSHYVFTNEGRVQS